MSRSRSGRLVGIQTTSARWMCLWRAIIRDPVVDRVEKTRISVKCVLKDHGQVHGQARPERDLERLDALG
eukprot:3419461-Prymnesium_polylepis.1